MATERFYTHSVVSYASIEEIRRLLDKATAWAYVKHDKDEGKTPHYHILATFQSQKSFKWVREQVASTQNTFSEAVKGNISDVLDYFTHKGFMDKYQYNVSDIVYHDRGYWERRANEQENERNSADEFIDDLLSPTLSVESMGRKYGRDFMKNCTSYMNYRQRCLTERACKEYRELACYIDKESQKHAKYFKLTEDEELVPIFEEYIFKE